MSHQCNYYCTPPNLHAFQVLAPAALSLAEQTQHLTTLMSTRGYALRWVRPAPEADPDAWRGISNMAGHVDAKGTPHILTPNAVQRRAPQCTLLALVDIAPEESTP